MSHRRARTNPFYLVLVLVGIAFSITACAYGVMALRAVRPDPVGDQRPPHPLLEFLDHHGMALLAGELALLAAATFLAMGTDRYWSADAEESAPTQTDPVADESVSRSSKTT